MQSLRGACVSLMATTPGKMIAAAQEDPHGARLTRPHAAGLPGALLG